MHDQKIVPVLATFFLRGRKLDRLLETLSLPDEKAETIVAAIKSVLKKHNIPKKKIVAICADNCPTNFGSVNRSGQGNVFALLREEFPHKLMGVGCLAHVLHNAIKNGCAKIDFQSKVDKVLYQLRSHFRSEPVRTAKFFQLRASLDIDCGLPESYVCTRWLSMQKALQTVIVGFDLYKEYFNEIGSCKNHKDFKDFFNNKATLPWLMTLNTLALHFERAIVAIEGSNISLVSALETFRSLQQLVQQQERDGFIPALVRQEGMKGWSKSAITKFEKDVKKLYKDCDMYMSSWTRWAAPMDVFRWTNLKSPLDKESVLGSLSHFRANQVDMTDFDEDKCREELDQVSPFIQSHIREWNKIDLKNGQLETPTVDRWHQVLDKFPDVENLDLLVSYVCCLPGSNAECERIFSEIKYFWSKWKPKLAVATVDAILKIKHNLTNKCEEMFDLLVSDWDLRRAVRSIAKYTKAKFPSTGPLMDCSSEIVADSDEDTDNDDSDDDNQEETIRGDELLHPMLELMFDSTVEEQFVESNKRPAELGTPSPKKWDKKVPRRQDSLLRKAFNFDTIIEEVVSFISKNK